MNAIKKISSKETVTVRHPVLRSGKNIETCIFEGDDLDTTHHFGYYVDGKLVGVISIYQNKNSNFNSDNQFQIRGMAVLNTHQKKGFGKQLINYCENFTFVQNNKLIWMNARVSAVSFYEKLGYKKINSSFEIKDVGFHFLMYKEIG
ncbi:MAG: GNAT family N-acetyltransferase [Flavobacterium sp.]|nr:GNAT family N-acetyltransferase [Flavobacterium sp.]